MNFKQKSKKSNNKTIRFGKILMFKKIAIGNKNIMLTLFNGK